MPTNKHRNLTSYASPLPLKKITNIALASEQVNDKLAIKWTDNKNISIIDRFPSPGHFHDNLEISAADIRAYFLVKSL